MLWTTEKTTIWRTVNEQKPKLCTVIARVFRSRRRFCVISYTSKNPAKQSSWLDSLVAAMWFEHMTLRVWKIKIENKRHGWLGGCGVVEDGSFVWIKHIYEYSKLTEISTVWKSRIVQDEVYIREKHLSFNIKKQCAKNALCFFLFAWLYSYNFSSGISSTPSSACASNPLREINAYR